MNTYLAKNSPFNNFDNMEPLYELIQGQLVEKDFSEEFPYKGKLTLYQDTREGSVRVQIPRVFVCKVDFNQINEVYPPVTDIRRNKLQVYANQMRYENIDSYDIHQVLEMPAYTNIEKLQKTGILYTSNLLPDPISNMIYIKDTINIYGPFTWKFNDNESLVVNVKAEQCNKIYEYRIDEISQYIHQLELSDHDGGDIYEIITTKSILANAKQIEFITDKDLHRKFVKDIKKATSIDLSINHKDIQEILDVIPELEMSEDRKKRIINDFIDYNALQEVLEELSKTAVLNPETSELVYTEILNNPKTRGQVIEDLKEREDFSEELSAAKSEINNMILVKDRLLDEVESIQKQIEDLNQEKQIETENEVIKELMEKQQKLTAEIEELQKKYDLSTQIRDWEAKIERQKVEHDSFTGVNASLKEALAEKVKNAYMDVAFNGQIANEVLKAAAGYAKNADHERYALMMAKQGSVPHANEKIMNPSEFIDMVQTTLNRDCHRMMSRNDVINILLCITQGFLTVFAGEPGSGKTSLCNYLSKILGLSRNDHYSRYIEVSVEKGWTSKRDFIGYYNPLTKQFDQANRKVFEAFNVLNHEAKNGINDYPFVVMLDEANLSPMEHYWADFMNTADMNKDKREINLNEQYELKIPKTLRFLATINYDHTTEILSPRLIDRAWIIMLESGNLNINDVVVDQEIEPLPIISYQQLTNVFGVNSTRSMEDNTVEKFNEINNTLRENGLFISPRVMTMIKNYCVVGSQLFDKKMNRLPALDYAVAQKILPMINGYGETYKMFLNNLSKSCDKNNMPISNRIIQDIIKKGESNMQYYQFFAK
ncbi:hypothetical protein [Acetobacterium sp. UBA5834]|jgi:hypothetical protein|uniref:hypothetical protein n=1 Tax=Acetobacterium sp. UBA5834 TaxID=1945907 RepID=UPI00257D1120|nr:hypothetical protein [Acetobacterium sp. UBA5834]